MRRPPARASSPLTPFLLLVLTLMSSSTPMNALEETDDGHRKVGFEDKSVSRPVDNDNVYIEDKVSSQIDEDIVHLKGFIEDNTALDDKDLLATEIPNKDSTLYDATSVKTYDPENNITDHEWPVKYYNASNDDSDSLTHNFSSINVIVETHSNVSSESSSDTDLIDINNNNTFNGLLNSSKIYNVSESNVLKQYLGTIHDQNKLNDDDIYANYSNAYLLTRDDLMLNKIKAEKNVSSSGNVSNISVEENYVNITSSNPESISPVNKDNNSKSKQYQSLHKGVRRKDNHITSKQTTSSNFNTNDNNSTSKFYQLTEHIHENNSTKFDKPNKYQTNTSSKTNHKKHANDGKENVSMEKLIDDMTRAKIYHDYSKTISKNSAKFAEATTKANTTDGNVLQRHTFKNKTGEDILTTEILMNETTGTVERSQVALLSRMQTPRPNLVNELTRNTTSRVVSILGLFELTIGDRSRADGVSELAAARLAIDHVNRRGLLPGYQLQLVTNDTKCDPGVGVDRFFHALYTERASRMVMVLGTACSDVTESIAKIVPYWNIVQVSFGATSPALSDRSEFPLFCRTVAPDSSHNPARIAFIRQFGWDTVTAFTQNEEVYSLAVNDLVTQLEAANITCAASITFAETDFKQQLLQLKELDTRIIIGSFSQEMIPKIFCEAYRLGMWGAEYAWLIAGDPPKLRGSTPCSRSHLATAIEGLVTVTAYKGAVGGEKSYSGLSMESFHQELQLSGVSMSPFAPQTYDAVWAMALAMSRSEQHWRSLDTRDRRSNKMALAYFDYDRKDMAEEFLGQLGNLSFLGVSGPVSFNDADRIGTTAFYQIQGGRPKIVALYTNGLQLECLQCSKAEWAGGIPAARRVLVLRIDSVWAPARLAIAVLAMAGVALALAFLLFNLHYSKRRSIKLSSPRLNNMTLIGCALVYTAVALLGVDNATLPSYVPFSAMCTGRVYILSAGFSLAFGSMFAKTYRVHRIFVSNRSGVCKTKLLQDTPLISLVCALLVIDGLIVTLWATLDPMERHLKNLTVEISATDRSVVYQPQIEVCKSQNTTGWLCALYAYKGLLLIVGVYMAWETRNVKISALNDSKYIGISVYSVVITSTSVVVIGTIISERATLAYITITSLILITTTSTLCLLFLPKIIAIRSKTEEDPVIQSLGLKLECKTRRFVTDDTQELHFRIEIQNKVYKREVAALDKEIGRLERLLAEPLESNSESNSISLHRRTELNTVEEESHQEKRTPSITGGLPMLLLSVLPPVIPRASWPSAEACRGRNSVSFSSQPKLDYRKSQPSIDLYNLCMNRREENPGILRRLKSFFGSRPSSRKTSATSIADPTNQGIGAALKLHVGMIAGLVPGNRKHSMVLSCNTLHVPHPELKLRRESYARSGPIIRVTDDEPSCSNYLEDRRVSSSSSSHHNLERRISTASHQFLSDRRKSSTSNKYISEPETKVNFVLPVTHKALSHGNSAEKIKGSPRFPHRITPRGSLTTLDKRKSADSVFNISGKICDEQRRYSHQNVDQEKCEVVLETRWRSTDDARPGPSAAPN